MPVVAIVGRPNVGKSTLFNHLVGQKRAIVGPERGITRDRIYGRLSLDGGLEADLVDTGGFDTTGEGDFSRHMFDQTMMAIRESDLVVCLFDALSELTADDRELVRILRESAIPVIYVANKVDDPNRSAASAMLYELGLQDFIEISARKKTGLKELKERIRLAVQDMPGTDLEHETDAVRVSILGRPNVGKSLLLNRIIGEERAIVSPVAGTTRDYIDIRVSHGGKDYVFVDTAGIRRKSRIQDMLERESVLRSLKNVNLSHVCLLLIDPAEGVTEQDKRISSIMAEHGRAFVVVVNKSDLIEPGKRTEIREAVHHSLKFIPDVRVVFISALTGKNVGKIYPLIDELFAKTTTQVTTGRLNRVLAEVTESYTPPVVKGRQVKFFYANQVGTVPPEFRIVTNFPDSIQPGYHRYLIHSFKKALSLQGVPIKLRFVPRS
ncbi:MAG TPA: ribosome biogenesis GTPase Der [Desulfomonilia bacterium]|nr:ribosome biogenesis GTPase Der [Deltaproteobacteria bacterium]HPD22036.1 ribosome biogenesis GTPase Der [Deltaproteobacteria bacterium]HRS56469.1 ribosome biogenesis GTPase Der [Desulfomonilia bacterium]HRV35744.1 ribosome biogenesis GTPase Der [Desulfomonilia bacterium]